MQIFWNEVGYSEDSLNREPVFCRQLIIGHDPSLMPPALPSGTNQHSQMYQ